jgi:hypothetical protein
LCVCVGHNFVVAIATVAPRDEEHIVVTNRRAKTIEALTLSALSALEDVFGKAGAEVRKWRFM